MESALMPSAHEVKASEEYLLIKIILHPNLSKYMKTGGHFYGGIYNISDFIMINCASRDRVKLIIGDKTLGEFRFDELRGITRNITTTIYGYPVTALITVRTLNISMFSVEFPRNVAYLKDRILEILKKSNFIRLLKSIGIEYYVRRVIQSKNSIPLMNESKVLIDGAIVIMDIRTEHHELEARCFIKLKTPYELYVSGIPEEFITPNLEESKNLLIMYIGSGVGALITMYHPPELPPLQSYKHHKKLNVTEELRSKIMETISENEVIAKLLKSRAKIEQINAAELEGPQGWERYITLTLTWPEYKGLRIEIDIIDDVVKRIEVNIQEP